MKLAASRIGALLGVGLIGLFVLLPSQAQSRGGHGGGGHGGGGHGDGHGGGRGGGWHRGGGPVWWGVGVGVGLGLGWEAAYLGSPYYYGYDPYYPYAYPAPAYDDLYDVAPVNVNSALVPPPPPGAATSSAAPSALPPPTSSSNWYYCASANGYYPYVTQCPEAWRMVPATPPGMVR